MSKQMTPTQRNYAVGRIRDITSLMRLATSEYFIKQGVKTMTIGEMITLIKKGTIKARRENFNKLYGNGYGQCNRLYEAFIIEDASPYYRTNPVRDEVKMRAALDKIDAKATGIKDRLMLGDAATALKMVEDFEKEAATLNLNR